MAAELAEMRCPAAIALRRPDACPPIAAMLEISREMAEFTDIGISHSVKSAPVWARRCR
jgi:hypothetical protein